MSNQVQVDCKLKIKPAIRQSGEGLKIDNQIVTSNASGISQGWLSTKIITYIR
jgi:hypothetical protein